MVPDGDEVIETEAFTAELTVIVRLFDVAGFPVAHDSEDVKTHLITSLLFRDVEE